VVDSTSNTNEYQAHLLGSKEGQCLGLTALPPSRADCLEICEPQLPGTVRPVKACIGIDVLLLPFDEQCFLGFWNGEAINFFRAAHFIRCRTFNTILFVCLTLCLLSQLFVFLALQPTVVVSSQPGISLLVFEFS
jgi:hypothetical protein